MAALKLYPPQGTCGMSSKNHEEHAHIIDTLAHLLGHLATTDEETGNKEILYTLIAKELRYQSEQILKN